MTVQQSTFQPTIMKTAGSYLLVVSLLSGHSRDVLAETLHCQRLFSSRSTKAVALDSGALSEMASLYLELRADPSILQSSSSTALPTALQTRMYREWQVRFEALSSEDRLKVRDLIARQRSKSGEEAQKQQEQRVSERKIQKSLMASQWPASQRIFVHKDPVTLNDLNFSAGAFFDPMPGKRPRAGIQWTEQGRYVAVRATNHAQSTKVYDLLEGRVLDLPPIGYLTREGNFFVEPRGNATIYHNLATGEERRFQGVSHLFASKSSDDYFIASNRAGTSVDLVDVRNDHRIPLGPEMAFSKKEDKLAYLVNGEMRVVDLATGQVRTPLPGRRLSTIQSPIGGHVWHLGDPQKGKMVIFDVATEKLYEPKRLNDGNSSWYLQNNTHFLHLAEQEPVPNPSVIPHPGEFYNFVTGERFQYQGGQMQLLTVAGKPMALISDRDGIRDSQLISLEDTAKPRIVMTLAPGSQPTYVGDLVFQSRNGTEFYVQRLAPNSESVQVPDLKSALQVRSYIADWAVGLVDLNAGKPTRDNPDYHSLDPFTGILTPMAMQLVNVSPDHRWQWVYTQGQLELRRFTEASARY